MKGDAGQHEEAGSPLTGLRARWTLWRYNLLKPGSKEYFATLMHTQSLPKDQIEEISWSKTRRILTHAYTYVPYYRRRFKEVGLRPEDVVVPKDYRYVPVLTRRDLVNEFHHFVSADTCLSKMRISTTGGSSGQPAKVCLPRNSPRAALGWRMLTWWGLSPGCDWARTYRDNYPTLQTKIVNWIATWPTKELLLNATVFSNSHVEHFLHQFNRLRPPLLQGYVGALDGLAGYILDRGLRVHSPKAIWATSAPLSLVQRRRLESAFEAPVYDQYGCCEVYWIAAQCARRHGLHIFHDERRVEFLDENHGPCREGEWGEVAVTDLMNYGFPLIRYLNGDRGRALTQSCDCGCNLPLMDQVQGRVSDTFLLPSGTRINGEFMTTLFDHRPDAVHQFRVHQHTDYSITIQVIPNPACCDLQKVLTSVAEKFAMIVNHEVPITMQPVERIEQKRGKLQFITSDVR